MQDRHGPLKTGFFEVQIGSVAVAGWQTIDLPTRYTETTEYEEGEDTQRTLWGEPTFDDLEMERGLAPESTELIDWRLAVERGQVDQGRKEIAVKLQNEEGEPQIQWTFTNAWIKEYSPPELDASADDELATESITVAFDRMEREEV